MSSVRNIEKAIWSALNGQMQSSSADEILGLSPSDVDAWTVAEWDRYNKAHAIVVHKILWHAGAA